jgi:hypothetical protein
VRFRGPLLLVKVLIILGLVLAVVAVGSPRAALSSQERAAASPSASEGMSSPHMPGSGRKSSASYGSRMKCAVLRPSVSANPADRYSASPAGVAIKATNRRPVV